MSEKETGHVDAPYWRTTRMWRFKLQYWRKADFSTDELTGHVMGDTIGIAIGRALSLFDYGDRNEFISLEISETNEKIKEE